MKDNKSSQNVKGLVKNFVDNTSMHGVPRITLSRGYFRKVVWVLLVVGGAALAMYHLGKIVENYRSYPLATVLSIENNNKLDFPAVTVCNMNPARRSILKEKAEEMGYTELIEVINEADAKRLEEENSGEEKEEEEEKEETDEDFYEALTNEFMISQAFSSIMSEMDRHTRMEIGHDLKEMMLSCTFEGRKCSVKNFTFSYNYKFGNCFTFNSNPKQSRLETTKPGPLYGLAMELYLDENEYSEFLADTVGAKLHVHEQGIMAFPEDDGISLTPGLSTSVGISQIQVRRSVPPHGRCRHYSSEDNMNINMYADTHKSDYSEKACQKTCYQKNLIRDCGCCHFDYPCYGHALKTVINDYSGQKLKRCNDSIPRQRRCMAKVFLKYEQDRLDCSIDCAQSCSETVYSTDISTGRWPSVPLIRRTMSKVRTVYKRKNESIPTSEEEMDTGDQLKFLTRNVIKVEIFYKQLNYEYLKAVPAYDWSSLISDIGGQVGLWIGFSVLTLIELAELLMDVVILISTKVMNVKQKKRVEMIQIQPTQTTINTVS